MVLMTCSPHSTLGTYERTESLVYVFMCLYFQISFQNSILAGASSDCSVGIWKPKNHEDKDSLEEGRDEEEGRAGEAVGGNQQ